MRNKRHDERLKTEIGNYLSEGREDYTLRKSFFFFIRNEVLEKDAVTDKEGQEIFVILFRLFAMGHIDLGCQ